LTIIEIEEDEDTYIYSPMRTYCGLGSVMRSEIIGDNTGVKEQRRSFNFDCNRNYRRILTGKKMKNDDNICKSNDNNKKMKTVFH
jgi:hypothetical protein